jgi:phospholipid/cholesterol/gamma-HCH transport system substrate-binding protein
VKDRLLGVIWRLGAFTAVCALCAAILLLVFAQLRFQDESTYGAEFANISGLEEGNFVRIAGVEVGKVKKIALRRDAIVEVQFSADETVTLTQGTKAAIRYDDVIGGRYLELLEGAGEVRPLDRGEAIAVTNTEPALDLDALIGGFRPLFRALDPDQVNALSGQLIQAFQGQGAAISSFLQQTASFTNTLADRDELIGQVIVNLQTVLGSLADESAQFDKSVDTLAQLIQALADRRTDITNSLAHTNAATRSIADLLNEVREPFNATVAQTDRVGNIAVADSEYLDKILNELPDAYQALSRQGMYGNYFNFYLCDVILKLNGKGGQPVYVKAAGQSTGRCAPK